MKDIALGEKVFRRLWDWCKMLYPMTFTYSFEEYKSLYGSKINIYLDGLGGFVREDNVSDSRIDSAMRSLALASNGRVLKNPIDLLQAFQGDIHKINWLDAASFVFTESGKDILKGAEKVGGSIITAGKVLNFLLPALIIIGALFLFNKYTQNSLVKTIGAAKKGLRK